MNLYIQTTVNPIVGVGHWYRCLRLAEVYQYYFNEIILVLRTGDRPIFEISYKIINSENPIEYLVKTINKGDIIIIDDYKTTKDEIVLLNEYKTIEINDIPQDAKNCKYLINQTPFISRDTFDSELKSECFLGASYLLVRQEFLEAINKHNANQLRSGFVFSFGGTDYSKTGLKYIKEAVEVISDPIHLITTNLNPAINELQELAWENKNLTIHMDINSNKVIELLLTAKYCITTASTFALEAICCGPFLICGLTQSNQQLIAKNLADNGIALSAGQFNETNFSKIIQLIDKASFEIQFKKRQLLLKEIGSSKLLEIIR